MKRAPDPPILRLRLHPPQRTLLQLVWELPQTLLGLAVLAVLMAAGRRPRRSSFGARRLYRTESIGVSLGFLVFWCCDSSTRRHELGHALQSSWLGPLYLVLVGLPSILRASYAWLYERRQREAWTRYYDAFPERWADRLGGVRRA